MENVKLVELLSKHREYNVVGHVRPDGDCVGSQLAVCNVLTAKNIRCHIVKNDDYGNILSAFFDEHDVIDCKDFDAKLPLICVDCSNFNRVGNEIFAKYETPYLNIDHHISNNSFAEHNVIDPDSSSTAQLIARLLLGEGVDFDKKTAEVLYLGIMTDSNRFAYDTTTMETVQIVEVLMEKGVCISEIYRKVYERDSLQKYRLLERFLHNMAVFDGGRCCTSFVVDDDFRETNAELLETEGFVNYTRKIDGVMVGAFLEFHDSYTKCSLRSESADFRMDLFAKQFGGGGHPAAAGFVIGKQDAKFYAKFQEELAQHLRKIFTD
ncbi:MAG: bifunctional oligoribonuclease/PAP phosphatase NrnA [Puniceicoccales bacterium]|jgi:phosphoesterase RecJ-like protein|nr:bifunctional oligoribonuclease/PAP phosphatase NrnA [Puniceicoccales bacterium]